jgi:hypothetical protein
LVLVEVEVVLCGLATPLPVARAVLVVVETTRGPLAKAYSVKEMLVLLRMVAVVAVLVALARVQLPDRASRLASLVAQQLTLLVEPELEQQQDQPTLEMVVAEGPIVPQVMVELVAQALLLSESEHPKKGTTWHT